jgi:hypothetical protein
MVDATVLLCIFNRPQLTQCVFERIREARPRQLLVVADGPRSDRPGESTLVAQSRAIIESVDWDCQVLTNFADHNMGCKRRIASGITWAFEQSEELIILEDDCLPDPTFFKFCDQLLVRYRHQNEIAMISGNNFQPTSRTEASYYFSHWPHIWGWATWKRAWQHFDADVSDWPRRKASDFFSNLFPSLHDQEYWQQVMDQQHQGLIDTWDFPWAYACWKTAGLAILPDHNLVTNIGFGDDATHTTDAQSRLAQLPTTPMQEIIHPRSIERNIPADQYTLTHIMSPTSHSAPDKQAASNETHTADFGNRGPSKNWLSSQWQRLRGQFPSKKDS